MNRFLIISNACFSQTDSNGRTLAKLFTGIDKENLSQFYTYGTPDFSVCGNYYRVTDGDALRSLIRFREFGGPVTASQCVSTENTVQAPTSYKKAKKTPFSMLLRETAWSLGQWKGKKLKQWLSNVNADAIILFTADNAFLIKLAIKIAKQKNIPIFIYTTEEYNLKDYNYLTRRSSMFYAFFHRVLKKWYEKAGKYVKCGFFNTPLLADAFSKNYSYPCEVVYNSSTIDFIENASVPSSVTVSYLGNLGVGRCYPLVEIANTLNELLPGTKLDVYGKLPYNQEEAGLLTDCTNICYKGFVSYEEVVSIIHTSTLVIHAEKDDTFYSRDLKYAFSTKIADSVCSGTPLFVYARKDLAITDFLLRNQCAFVASSKDTLKSELKKALSNEDERKSILRNAKEVRNNLFLSNNRFLNRLADYLRKE